MSVMMTRQVSTTQVAQKQRQVPVIQKVLRTTQGPTGAARRQVEEEQTVAVVKVVPQERILERTVEHIADVPVITEQLTRARRDSAGAGFAAHRRDSNRQSQLTPVSTQKRFRVRER